MATRKEAANALRALAMDAVQKANSGHPGMPMGMADIAEVLWNGHLRFNPHNPAWPDRDRFVLSNGHGSMLLYGLLHLSGYDLSLEELKNFRQLHSKTPGHPEHGLTPGVETTTGPLGQGLANAVGMALAERLLAAEFNRPGLPIVDHFTYAFAGDGCLMEGISHEAASLAGTLGLEKLILFYDDNGISIDGEVAGWFTDDTPARFRAYGWNVIPSVDGHDSVAVDGAIHVARKLNGKPTLICCKTIIGFGSPGKQGKEASHGAPLGEKEVAAARLQLGWNYPPFEIPAEVYAHWDARARGLALETTWNERFKAYQEAHPERAAEFLRRARGELPSGWEATRDALVASVVGSPANLATRKASQNMIEALGPAVPELLGGSADLASSNLTIWSGSHSVGNSGGGNYLHYGVREFAMAAMMSGVALHGGYLPYGGTFLTFSDYCRSALRMAALMRLRSVYVFTHDSIGLGEDGPTHQPVEHAASLRLIPQMDVWRPCDTVETAVAWTAAIERNGPSALLLSRQSLPFQPRDAQQVEEISRGGYVLVEASSGVPTVILIATGSEVALAVAARGLLEAEGIGTRVVSMPCTSRFDVQDPGYRSHVLPRGVPRVAVEAGVGDYWRKYVGLEGAVVAMDHFGESAPAEGLFPFFGFTAEAVASTARGVLRH